MAKISASSLNQACKCELASILSRTEEAKKLRADSGFKFSMSFGSICHDLIQTYDIDRFVKKLEIPKTQQEMKRRYEEAWLRYFTGEESVKKEKISEEQQELARSVILPKLSEWLWEENVKKQAELNYFIKSQQDKMFCQFTVRKSILYYYEFGFKIFQQYVLNNPMDIYGVPVEFCIEKLYSLKYGSDDITGYVDERRVYEINGKRKIFLIEFKTSATEYNESDCQIDNQTGLYAFYESVENETPLEDIYLGLYQLPTGVCTLTQRTEENVDLLMRHVDERLRRQNEIAEGVGMPMPSCGTNSFEHARLFCDFKSICPVWKQCESQPKPIVLGKKEKDRK